MSVEDLIVYGKKYLHSNDVKMLLANVLEYDSLEMLNHLHDNVPNDKVELFKRLIDARVNNYPLQYILGDVNFYGYKFYVDENVLIPRFETEGLVECALSFIDKHFKAGARVIDLGCGSGVIGITLKKKNSALDVSCLDISKDALKICERNAKELNANINIIHGDMLDNINEKFDIIVSNPPYIKTDEEIEDIVKNNEPHIALYGGDDGLTFYNKILSNASRVLNDQFLIAFEIGMTQGNDVTSLAKKYLNNVNVEVLKDLSGKDRYVLIYSNNFD